MEKLTELELITVIGGPQVHNTVPPTS